MSGHLPMVKRLAGLLIVFVHVCIILSKSQAALEYEFDLQLYQPNVSWLICPQGWTKFGTKCFNLYTEKATFVEAETICRSAGGHLLEISTLNKNREVTRVLTNYTNIWHAVWIGFLREKTGSFKWTNGKITSWTDGIWLLGQPQVVQNNADLCVAMVISNTSEQFRWTLDHCDHNLAFLCEVNVCVTGEFRCRSGRCVPNAWLCDGQSDCEDFSDEQNCSAETCGGRVHEPQFQHPVTKGNYLPWQHCQWQIEAPVGARVNLTFPHFVTEQYYDIVSIYDGPTSRDTIIGTFSGSIPPNNIISTTNMLLVTFSSDNSIQKTGFGVYWESVNYTCGDSKLVANNNTKWIVSPNYAHSYPGNVVCKWIISSQGKVISFKVIDLDLFPGDVLAVWENSVQSYVLASYTGNGTGSSTLLFSTGGDVTLQLSTDLTGSGKGFNITYQTGCDISSEIGYGQISSPGFGAGLLYPPNVHCTIYLLDSEHRELTIIFEHFDTELQFDYMEIYNSTLISSSTLLINISGLHEPWTLHSSTGQLVLVFHSDSMVNRSGWNASFSYDCNETDYLPAHSHRNSSHVQYNSPIMYVCDTGYLIQGSSLRYCEIRGVWRTPVPSCILRYCGPPPQLKNGRLVNLTSRYYNGVSYYKCDDTYSLIGGDTVTCLEEGWTALPLCKALTCSKLPPLQNGRTIPLRSFIQERVKFECNNGYRLVGYTQAECSNDGTWSQGLPYCIREIYCPEITISHGSVSPAGPIRSEESILVTCYNGYRLLDGVHANLTCTDTGTYDKSVPSCVVVCPAISVVNATQLFYSRSPLPDGSYPYPTTVWIQCPINAVLDGPPVINCTKSGWWSASVNSCQIIQCGTLPEFSYGTVEYIKQNHPLGTFVKFSCNQGYSIHGNRYRFCSNGNWSGEQPTCAAVSCGEPPSILHGDATFRSTTYGSKVVYTCHQGYRLVGDTLRTCQSTGVWSAEIIICVEEICPNLMLSDYVTMVTKPEINVKGLNVSFTCDKPGYQITDPFPVTCVSAQDVDVPMTILPHVDYLTLTVTLTLSSIHVQNISLQCKSTFQNVLSQLKDNLINCQYSGLFIVDMVGSEIKYNTSSNQMIWNVTLAVLPSNNSYLAVPEDACLESIGGKLKSAGCSMNVTAKLQDNCPLMEVIGCESVVHKIVSVCETGEAVNSNNFSWCIQIARGPVAMVDIEIFLKAVDMETGCIYRLYDNFMDVAKKIVDQLDLKILCTAVPNAVVNITYASLSFDNNQISLKMPFLLYDFTSPFQKVQQCAAIVANSFNYSFSSAWLALNYKGQDCPFLQFATYFQMPLTYTLCPQGFQYHGVSRECVYCGDCLSIVLTTSSAAILTTPLTAAWTSSIAITSTEIGKSTVSMTIMSTESSSYVYTVTTTASVPYEVSTLETSSMILATELTVLSGISTAVGFSSTASSTRFSLASDSLSVSTTSKLNVVSSEVATSYNSVILTDVTPSVITLAASSEISSTFVNVTPSRPDTTSSASTAHPVPSVESSLTSTYTVPSISSFFATSFTELSMHTSTSFSSQQMSLILSSTLPFVSSLSSVTSTPILPFTSTSLITAAITPSIISSSIPIHPSVTLSVISTDIIPFNISSVTSTTAGPSTASLVTASSIVLYATPSMTDTPIRQSATTIFGSTSTVPFITSSVSTFKTTVLSTMTEVSTVLSKASLASFDTLLLSPKSSVLTSTMTVSSISSSAATTRPIPTLSLLSLTTAMTSLGTTPNTTMSLTTTSEATSLTTSSLMTFANLTSSQSSKTLPTTRVASVSSSVSSTLLTVAQTTSSVNILTTVSPYASLVTATTTMSSSASSVNSTVTIASAIQSTTHLVTGTPTVSCTSLLIAASTVQSTKLSSVTPVATIQSTSSVIATLTVSSLTISMSADTTKVPFTASSLYTKFALAFTELTTVTASSSSTIITPTLPSITASLTSSPMLPSTLSTMTTSAVTSVTVIRTTVSSITSLMSPTHTVQSTTSAVAKSSTVPTSSLLTSASTLPLITLSITGTTAASVIIAKTSISLLTTIPKMTAVLATTSSTALTTASFASTSTVTITSTMPTMTATSTVLSTMLSPTTLIGTSASSTITATSSVLYTTSSVASVGASSTSPLSTGPIVTTSTSSMTNTSSVTFMSVVDKTMLSANATKMSMSFILPSITSTPTLLSTSSSVTITPTASSTLSAFTRSTISTTKSAVSATSEIASSLTIASSLASSKSSLTSLVTVTSLVNTTKISGFSILPATTSTPTLLSTLSSGTITPTASSTTLSVFTRSIVSSTSAVSSTSVIAPLTSSLFTLSIVASSASSLPSTTVVASSTLSFTFASLMPSTKTLTSLLSVPSATTSSVNTTKISGSSKVSSITSTATLLSTLSSLIASFTTLSVSTSATFLSTSSEKTTISMEVSSISSLSTRSNVTSSTSSSTTASLVTITSFVASTTSSSTTAMTSSTSVLTTTTPRVPLLECFVCTIEKTNDECIAAFESCTQADSVCETEVRYSSRKLLFITKRCSNRKTCELDANGAAGSCDISSPSPTCYYCCSTSKCNMNVTLLSFPKGRRKRSTGNVYNLKWNNTVPKCIDVEAPVFQKCPIYPLVEHSTTIPVFVTMEKPVATDNSGMEPVIVIQPSNFSVPYLIYKDTVVKFTATDPTGNAADCIVNIQINFQPGCHDLISPYNVNLICTNFMVDYVKTISCLTECKNNTTAVLHPSSKYSCTEGGVWVPSSYIPDCVNNELSECPVLTYNVTWILIPQEGLLDSQCYFTLAVKDAISHILNSPSVIIEVAHVLPTYGENILVQAMFSVSTKLWSSGTVCPNVDVSVLDNITVTNRCNVTALLIDLTHTDTIDKKCPPGLIILSSNKSSAMCWPCPLGTELNQNVCTECLLGYYRNNFTQISCQKCPNGTSTIGLHAQNMSECLAVCEAGHFSPNGLAPCSTCPKGYYQPTTKSKECISCPVGKCTLNPGTSTEIGCDESYCTNQSDPCVTSPCQQAGTCQASGTEFVCRCSTDYTGSFCEYHINPCAKRPCEYGECLDNYFNNTYTCICYHGFTGNRCTENIDDCVEQPCYNGGYCIDLVESYVCNCTGTGFYGSHCELPVENCLEGNCLHGGTCIETGNNFTCNCSQGYIGEYCELQEDPCIISPCQQNQVCITNNNNADLQRYCLCKPSFTGPDCATAIHCNDAQCNSGGVCEDIVSGQICHCYSGYTGEFCETAITTVPCQECNDSCVPNPCKNMGNCSHDNGYYACICVSGYTGQNCQINIDDCRGKPCQNGGTCVDLVNGYTCICGEDFTGRHCTDEVDSCQNSWCIHGKCFDKLHGFVCRCDDGWSGENCATQIHSCFSLPCQNSASCLEQSSNFSCLCTKEYTGITCETKILLCDPNPCLHDGVCTELLGNLSCTCLPGFYGSRCENSMQECNVTECQNGGKCVDGIPGCQCPPNFIGPLCEKEKYSDYDMVLNGRSFGACRSNRVTKALSEMSLCLWMSITRATDSILQLIDDNNQSLLEVSVDRVLVNFWSSEQHSINLTSNSTGKSWNFVCVTWSAKSNGQWMVYVDKVITSQNYSSGIGQTISSFRLQLGSNVYGTITGVNMYNYVLNISYLELTNCSENNGNVIHWGDFLSCAVDNRATIQPSSISKLKQCGSNLSLGQTIDKVPPQVIFCPGNIAKVIPADTLLTTVTWHEPEFQDESGLNETRQTHQSGQIFAFGEYLVIYAAFDHSSNYALCSFTIVVSKDCKNPPPPLNGALNCTPAGNDRICITSCLDGFAAVEDVALVYKCGLEGIWDPPRGEVFSFPPCAGFSVASQLVAGTILVTGAACSQSSKTNIISMLQQQFKTLNASYVRVDCVSSEKKKRSSERIQFTFNFTVNSSTLEESSLLLDQLMSSLKSNSSEYTMVTYNSSVMQICDEGQMLNKQNLCVNCGKGYFYNKMSRQCELCPIGTYTSIEKQTTCMSCAQGKTTLVAGSYLSSQCFSACESGHYIWDGICEKCELGYYQDMKGAAKCKPCPFGKITSSTGSARQSDCYLLCAILGRELNVNGTCLPCPIGKYKDDILEIICKPCPVNYTTPTIGAQSLQQCSLDTNTTTHTSIDISTQTSQNTSTSLVVVSLFFATILMLTVTAVIFCLYIRKKVNRTKMSCQQRIHRSEFQSSFRAFALAHKPMHDIHRTKQTKGNKKRKCSDIRLRPLDGETENSINGSESTEVSFF